MPAALTKISAGLSPRVRGNPALPPAARPAPRSIPTCAGEPRPAPGPTRWPRVYPRACGGTLRRPHRGPEGQGLSPRVRGNRVYPPVAAGRCRSIPARAGEPPCKREWSLTRRVYPRVCGGTINISRSSSSSPGLSPRVRGNPHGALQMTTPQRSIPACAGEPRRTGPRRHPQGVYPRVCGGTVSTRHPFPSVGGLSPRVRGNPDQLRPRGRNHGSIPACAGEPNARGAWLDEGTVYPRVCGGTATWNGTKSSSMGLSPRVRGNPAQYSWSSGSLGSIPACAGEPNRVPAAQTLPRVYPRVCGGTPSATGTGAAMTGLSPRVRGNRQGDGELLSAFGSIPACAGEPSRPACGRCGRRVYPRVCGGTDQQVIISGRSEGLSPRVRGNLDDRGAFRLTPGSIPACAGEPRSDSLLAASMPGLSPRVRGNLHDVRRARRYLRSIPACAGEPGVSVAFFDGERVYPRVCGGTALNVDRSGFEMGLSPRVRGNRTVP